MGVGYGRTRLSGVWNPLHFERVIVYMDYAVLRPFCIVSELPRRGQRASRGQIRGRIGGQSMRVETQVSVPAEQVKSLL
jgi:hypothetical protein